MNNFFSMAVSVLAVLLSINTQAHASQELLSDSQQSAQQSPAQVILQNLSQKALGRDSVAVFLNKEKMNILINERGQGLRLHQFMDSMGWGENHYWENSQATIKIHCARELDKSVCVFTLKPSELVEFQGRSAQVKFNDPSFKATHYSMAFASSMQDRFYLEVVGSEMYLWAGKKGEEAPF